MILYHAHAVPHTPHQFQFKFQQLVDALKVFKEMLMEIACKTVLQILSHQTVHLDLHQMVMETASHLSLWLLVLMAIHLIQMEFANHSTKLIHQHKLYVKQEIIVMAQETVFQTLFQ